MARSKARESERENPVVGLVVMLGFWLTVALLPLFYGLSAAKLAFGLSGEPGQVTVEKCVRVGSGKSRGTDCRGWFTPQDGSRVYIHLPPESKEGETFPARLQPDGEHAYPTDVSGRLAALALPALGVLFLVPMPLALIYMLSTRGPGRLAKYSTAAVAALAGCLCMVGLVASYV